MRLVQQSYVWALVASFALLLSACGSKNASGEPPRSSSCDGIENDAKRAGKTGVAGAKTGVTTGVEGVKQLGDSAVGLVEGGSAESKRRWKERGKQTKQTANEGAEETRREAHSSQCK